jgi:hypothetical protein
MDDTFLRDPSSKALINKDGVGLDAYKKRREQSRKIEVFSQDINTLKSELEEIKTLLTQLINKE